MALSRLLLDLKGVIHAGMPQPVWVRAEIARLDYHGGHAYLDLSERADDGRIVAQCRAMIWSQNARAIEAKFMAATGENLKKDIKVLCLAKVQLHEYYGLSLHIEDIDPAFTLGDLAARLAMIRHQLQEEGISQRNQALTKPTEFLRVAIISPKSSAGLGDFRREADQLQAHGICQFQYFTASFQGPETSGSLRQAIREAYAVHQESPFDALAIIRGGGSATDLAWLNDYQLARWVCRVPIPVFTGIGHKQDNTILDEVAHTRFDTPSKVILHIVGTIWNNAVETVKSMKRIREQVLQLHLKESNAVASQAEAIVHGARGLIERRSTECEAFRRIVELSLVPRLREWHSRVERGQQSIGHDAANRLGLTSSELSRLAERVRERALARVEAEASHTYRGMREIGLKAISKLDSHRVGLGVAAEGIRASTQRVMASVLENVEGLWQSARSGAERSYESARRAVEGEAKAIVAAGPEASLRRGFVIVREEGGSPITSRQKAARLPGFDLQFHDGSLRVANLEQELSDGESA